MHEVSVASELLDIIFINAEIHNIKEVKKIVLKIGEFTCIQENALRFAFKAISKKTLCANAQLVIETVKAAAYCENCKQCFDINYTNKICPKCGQFSFNITTGYELLLESIEGEKDETDINTEKYIKK